MSISSSRCLGRTGLHLCDRVIQDSLKGAPVGSVPRVVSRTDYIIYGDEA